MLISYRISGKIKEEGQYGCIDITGSLTVCLVCVRGYKYEQI